MSGAVTGVEPICRALDVSASALVISSPSGLVRCPTGWLVLILIHATQAGEEDVFQGDRARLSMTAGLVMGPCPKFR